MTVYVDNMQARVGTMRMCHMLADSDEELHTMADTIGVSRRWWQSPASTSGGHYDIAMSKRALAVAAGAVQVSMRQAAAMNARRRATGRLGSPDNAVAWLTAHRAARRRDGQLPTPTPTSSLGEANNTWQVSGRQGASQRTDQTQTGRNPGTAPAVAGLVCAR